MSEQEGYFFKAITGKQSFEETTIAIAYDMEAGGHYSDALEIWRKLAEKGNAEAQFNIALLYIDGCGTSQNSFLAAQHLKQGYSLAQVELGNLYLAGDGVEENHDKAISWFRKAVQQGDPIGTHNLGTTYCNGLGIAGSVRS